MAGTDTIRYAEKECRYDDHQVVFYARYGDLQDCTVIRTVQSYDGRQLERYHADHIRWEDRLTTLYEKVDPSAASVTFSP